MNAGALFDEGYVVVECKRTWRAGGLIEAIEAAESDGAASASKERLYSFLRDHTVELLAAFRLYAVRLDLASGESARLVAYEILQEVAVEALTYAERFDPQRQPMAWLLGIAVNVIRRKQVRNERQKRREVPFSQLCALLPRGAAEHEWPNNDYVLGALAPLVAGPEHEIEAGEQVDELLALVAPDDREVLRIALVEGAERAMLAERLGTTAGAASMRLHRALRRLRSAWLMREGQQKGDDGDA